MTRALAILAIACTVVAARAEPPAPSGKPGRIAYIAGALDAIAATDRAALGNTTSYIYAIERNKCQAPDEALHVGCLLEVYPYHLHLKNFVEIFRRQYKLHRGRL